METFLRRHKTQGRFTRRSRTFVTCLRCLSELNILPEIQFFSYSQTIYSTRKHSLVSTALVTTHRTPRVRQRAAHGSEFTRDYGPFICSMRMRGYFQFANLLFNLLSKVSFKYILTGKIPLKQWIHSVWCRDGLVQPRLKLEHLNFGLTGTITSLKIEAFVSLFEDVICCKLKLLCPRTKFYCSWDRN